MTWKVTISPEFGEKKNSYLWRMVLSVSSFFGKTLDIKPQMNMSGVRKNMVMAPRILSDSDDK